MAPVRSSATSCMAEKVAWLDAYEMAAGIRILWRCLACGRLPHSLLGGILTARSQTLHPDRPAHPINRHTRSPSTHSRCACSRADATPMGTPWHSWEYRAVPTPATLETIFQLLFLFFPVADFRLGDGFKTIVPLHPRSAGLLSSPSFEPTTRISAPAALQHAFFSFGTRPVTSSSYVGLHLDSLCTTSSSCGALNMHSMLRTVPTTAHSAQLSSCRTAARSSNSNRLRTQYQPKATLHGLANGQVPLVYYQ